MAFPKKYAEFAARTRIATGFLIGAAFLWLAQPTAQSLLVGGGIALVGLWIRAWAAGHLRKNQELAISGPYAHVRNPLYVGTLTAGIGFGVAGAHVGIAVAMVAFFLLYYLPVVEEEESHLRKILPGYEEYVRRVPRIVPALVPRGSNGAPFSFSQYRKNREYEALAGFFVVMALLAGKAYWLG